MKPFIEYNDSSPCPCGSQKPYSTCCKLKAIKWGYNQNGELIKQIPISSESKEELKVAAQMFEKYYGRKPNGEDYVLSFAPIYQDEILFKVMQAMQSFGMPAEDIYAYYKTDGLLPCGLNDQLISEEDKKEFLNYRDEYCNSMNEPLRNPMNSLQFTVYGNELLESTFDKAQEMMINSLTDFIHRHSIEPNGIHNYEMKSEIDYLLFSAIKTIKTIKGISLIVQEQIPECIHALGRSLFENYMYLNKMNSDSNFFKQKLLPKVDKEHFQFTRKKDGKIDYNRVVNVETGEIHNVHIIISELKNYFLNSEDQDLYNLYYSNSCQYIHVDVLSAANYFYTYDPYDELNPSLQAAIITIGITILLYDALIHNQFVNAQFYQDASYFIKQLTKKLIVAMELLNSDPKHAHSIAPILLKRLQTLTKK